MIDWERITELRDEVGAEDFGEVIELFLDEVDAVLERLKTEPNPAAFEDDFHFLKGSALNLGFATFSKLCTAYERAAAAGDFDTIEIAVALESYAESKAAFSVRAQEFGLAA